MRIVVDLQCLQTSSRYRGIGRYARSLTRALIRNRGDHDICVALRRQEREYLDEIRAEFVDILHPENISVCEVFNGIEFSNPDNAWKRTVSEHVWSLNLSTIGADMVLCPSPFEGFDEDFVSTTQRMGQFGVAAIIHDLFPYHDPCRYIGSKLACDWYNTKLSEITSLNILFANS